jgi:putative sigma-54 modulation protein
METKAIIFTKNMELSDRVEEYINKKIGKIGKFLPDVDDTKIDLAYIKSARNAADRYVSQITIRGKGYILRTEERADDIFTAFDNSLEKMLRQIERFKGKRSRSRNEKISAIAGDEAEKTEVETEELPVIVRRKKFHLVPMNENEAIDQMQLLGHEEFFIFYNGETSAVNVLYKRNDGTYGLIESEIA